MWSRLKAKRWRIPHIQIVDPPSGGFDALCLTNDVTNRVREMADALRDRDGEVC
jgi:hypothetical protein